MRFGEAISLNKTLTIAPGLTFGRSPYLDHPPFFQSKPRDPPRPNHARKKNNTSPLPPGRANPQRKKISPKNTDSELREERVSEGSPTLRRTIESFRIQEF
jgi:hypothetical protein